MSTRATPTVVRGADLPPLGYASSGRPFDRACFNEVRNQVDVSGKPQGGLWLSLLTTSANGRVRAEWVPFAHDLWGVHLDTYPVAVDPDARIIVIDSAADFDTVLAAYPPEKIDADLPDPIRRMLDTMMASGFDYEAMSHDADALWLTADGAQANRHVTRMHLWDIESVLVLNADVVTST